MAARGSQISKSYRILSNSRLSPPIRKHGLLLLQGLKTTVFNTIASSCSGLFLVFSPGKLKHWWLRGKDGGRRDKVAFLCDLRVRARKYHLVLTVQSQVNINVSGLLSWYCETSFLLTLFFFFWTANAPWLTSFTWSCIKVMIKGDSGICSLVWKLLGVVGETRIQVVKYNVDLICISA